MKKEKLLSTLLSVAALSLMVSACSSDETLAVSPTVSNQNQITYGVSTNTLTRAANVYDNNTLPSMMYVWASYVPTAESTADLIYFNNDKVTRNTEVTNVWSGKGTQYWPNSGKLNFFALSGIETAPTGENWIWGEKNRAPMFNYTLNTDITKQEDVLYAVNMDQAKPQSEDGYVALNFRHALAQVAFKVSVTHSDLYVVVKSISVNNVNSHGTFKFPTETTTAAITGDHSTYGTDDKVGSWYNRDGHGKYTATFELANSSDWGAKIDGTTAEAEGTMMLIPGDYSGYKLVGGQKPSDSSVYFSLKCKIYHKVSGTSSESGDVDTSSDILLWDGSNNGSGTDTEILIPAELKWEPGRKYTYTIVFGGEGHAGWDGDNPSEKVLFPISYQSEVDNWIDGGNTNMPM